MFERLREDVREIIKMLCSYKGAESVEECSVRICAYMCIYVHICVRILLQNKCFKSYGIIRGKELCFSSGQ